MRLISTFGTDDGFDTVIRDVVTMGFVGEIAVGVDITFFVEICTDPCTHVTLFFAMAWSLVRFIAFFSAMRFTVFIFDCFCIWVLRLGRSTHVAASVLDTEIQNSIQMKAIDFFMVILYHIIYKKQYTKNSPHVRRVFSLVCR